MLNSLPTHEPSSTWSAPDLGLLPSWRDARRVAIDCETRDPDLLRLGPGVRRGASIVGVSFAVEDGASYYLPVGHEAGGNLDRTKVFEYLKDQARSFRGDLAGANLSYDLDFLLQAGVDFRPKRFRDCLIAEPLLDENQFSYSLEAVASRRGLPGKEERGLRQAASAFGLDPKADLWRLHAKHVGPYAERDARLPLLLLRKQEREISDQDLETVWDLECRVLPLLVQMRRRGVRIDRDHIAVVEERCGREEVASMAEFSRLVGKRILPEDMNKAALVGPAIEAATGQKLPRTPSGMFQVKMNLERSNLLGLDGPIHPAVAMYLRARRFNKCRTTFVESIREHAVGDRVHCSFNQMKVEREDGDTRGTVSGRLSSGDPNLQQQPNRDPEIGPLWRSIYLPEEGEEWACLDYCYDAETEVLTGRGWVKFPDLHHNDVVAQWEAGIISYVRPTARYRSPYRHDLVTIRGDRQVDLAVTYNHDCVLLNNSADAIKVKAPDYSSMPSNYTQPQNGILLSSSEVDVDALRLAAAVQADASDRGTSYRFWLKRPRKIERLTEMLVRLGVKYTTGYSKAKAQHYFTIPKDGRLGDLLLAGKEFNRKLLLDLTPELRREFIHEVGLWDGRPANGDYFSTHIGNCETVQELAVLTGFRSNLRMSETKAGRPFGTVSLNEKAGTLIKTLKQATAPYDGLVYCVTVPAGAILVRRNGRVCVSGNSQQEPRWVVHFAERTGCYMAREAGDRYRANPALDNHQMVADMIGWPGKEGRKKAKGIYLGKIYGMGDAKFCRSVGLPTVEVTRWDGTVREEAGPEGRKMLDEFRDRAPFLGEVAMKAVLRAKEQHFVKTILGRRCRFEVAPNGKVLYTHKSLNRIVQGTSADQTKKAMVDAEDAGIPLRLQVHDELDLSVASRETGDRLAVIMRDAIPCRVPHLVEPKYGRSWGELK